MKNNTASTSFTNIEFSDSWSSGTNNVMLNGNTESFYQEKLNIFHEFVKQKTQNDSVKNLLKEEAVVLEAERLDIKDQAVLVLCELLLGESILQEIETHRILFLRFTRGNRKSQKYLLGGLERMIHLHEDSLMSKVPEILKAFYHTDVLEEEVLVDWSQNVSDEYVSKEVALEIREKAVPFFEWLRESEEERFSSDDDHLKDYI